MAYNRAKAIAYARQFWTAPATDGYVGVGTAPGYKKVPDGTVFVRKTKSDPSTEVARFPDGTEIPLAELEDCAHFISHCLGKPPNHAAGAGGLQIRSDNQDTYGRLSARRLYADLKRDGLIQIVDSERIGHAKASQLIQAAAIAAGDLIFYFRAGQAEPGHVGVYLGGAGRQIACHTYCRADQEHDYNQSWDSVNLNVYTLAKVK